MILQPFPLEDHAPLLWSWLQEYPDLNFDDLGPKDADELRAELRKRHFAGEELFEVWHCAYCKIPIGAIGYLQLSPTLGQFHGICFASEVHGTGIARDAVRELLRRKFAEGTRRVEALYFARNERVRRFFEKLGATDEGLIERGSFQRGQPIDWRKAVIYSSPPAWEASEVPDDKTKKT